MNKPNSSQNKTPFDSDSAFVGYAKVQDNDLIMAVSDSNVQPQLRQQRSAALSQSFAAALQRASLIDNTLAQACSLKRARGSSSPLVKSKSDPSIKPFTTKFTYRNRTPVSTVKIFSTGTSGDLVEAADESREIEDICPYVFIQNVLIDENDSREEKMRPLHADEFLRPTEEQIAAYGCDALAAVRTSDISALREMHASGRTLRCCNRFGESLLHVACRRSNADVVSYLLNEADVSPRIKDDYGRTPLHDACWRGNPEYEIVELLLSAEPRLAFVQDVRGHKPFQYARKEHWGAW
eukprot:CAMPEP_0181099148 /NCGR_PEP_ID=MMETSP1071-20121207/12505_1 /TAXON_ID=35127 /ORGANISM="Thalassiosira sp., Strain NH16" /LENGTH=294 /DNA_ID=CAMNT_0023181791 /DNA_START=276 /DNA_END=1157 /DNA_ORIENTATION=+